MNNIFTDIQKKRLYKFLTTANDKQLDKYMKRLSKIGKKEPQFTKATLFKVDSDKINDIDLAKSCIFTAQEMGKVAIVEKCKSYIDVDRLKNKYKNNGMAIRLALYNINDNAPECKIYKVKLSNEVTMNYYNILYSGLKYRKEIIFVINGFFYRVNSYIFIGGNKNECIATFKRL